MSAETAMRAHLLADSTLAGLIATRLYPLTLPQNPTYPAVTYQRISRRPVHVKPAIINPIVNVRWQFDVHAETYSALRSAAEALKDAIYTYSSGVYESMVDSEYEMFDDLTKTYRTSVDALIWEAEA